MPSVASSIGVRRPFQMPQHRRRASAATPGRTAPRPRATTGAAAAAADPARRRTTGAGRSATSSSRSRARRSTSPRSERTSSGRKMTENSETDASTRNSAGQQAAGPAEVELADVDAAAVAVLGEQQRRDQVAADREEHVDAEEPARHPGDVGVVQQHGADAERAQAVEARDVPHAARRAARRRAARVGPSGFGGRGALLDATGRGRLHPHSILPHRTDAAQLGRLPDVSSPAVSAPVRSADGRRGLRTGGRRHPGAAGRRRRARGARGGRRLGVRGQDHHLRAPPPRCSHPVTTEIVTTDGFLYPNAELERRGLTHEKGFPAVLRHRRAAGVPRGRCVRDRRACGCRCTRTRATTSCPMPRASSSDAAVVIVEGVNALQFRDHLDLGVYVDAPEAGDRAVVRRPARRHVRRRAGRVVLRGARLRRGAAARLRRPGLVGHQPPQPGRAHPPDAVTQPRSWWRRARPRGPAHPVRRPAREPTR